MLTGSVTINHFHSVLSVFIALLSVLFFSIFFLMSYIGSDYFVTWEVFSSWVTSFSIEFSFTSVSILFSSLVSFITSVVFFYSYFYIGFYTNYKFFLFTTFGFVLSILLVINCTDIFIVMLGWDGLGVISFFLIVYYNSGNSVYSGFITMLLNRVGDSLLVISCAYMAFFNSVSFSCFTSAVTNSLVLVFLILGLITKSALFPFSPWLPAAMSAPTPISSLVHSSTLVTAGLYLMIRFSNVIYTNPHLIHFLLTVSLFTTLYAGLNSVVECDLKNLIALSTLSHLGFIGLSISSGFDYLAVFHLFTHALFKSLVFMALGEVISSQSHYQDIRFLSSGLLLTPVSSSYIFISSLSLFGLPFVSGFYSNDYVLECFHSSYWMSSVIIFLIYLNLVFTYVYTSRILGFCISTVKCTSYFSFVSPSSHVFHLFSLSLLSLFFGWFYANLSSFSSVLPVVPLLRTLPSLILLLVLLLYLSSFNSSVSISPVLVSIFGTILFLVPSSTNLLSTFGHSSLSYLTNSIEHGLLSSSFVHFYGFSAYCVSRLSWYFINAPLFGVLFASFFLILFFSYIT